MLLVGSDLIATMPKPDLVHILGRYGVLIIERASTDADQVVNMLVH